MSSLRKTDWPLGTNARTVGGASTRDVSYVTWKSSHWDNGVATVKRCGVVDELERQEVSSDESIGIISETGPVLAPLASSRDATNCVPVGNGRKVTAAPVRVTLFQSELDISMDIGVRLKGTTVNVRGSDAGSLPPVKCTEKLPHCWTAEKVIELKERTTCGPKARRMLARAR